MRLFRGAGISRKVTQRKERADNIIKLRQRLDDFSEYSASRGVELTGELHDLLLNVGIAIIDGQILKANINVGRIKVSISSNAKAYLQFALPIPTVQSWRFKNERQNAENNCR